MTQEEKAKAYDELKVKASRIYNKENDVLIMHTIEDLFPELKESEDERIRKGLIKALSSIGKRNWGGIDVFESISWLEKQAQNPTWSEKDKNMLEWVIAYFNNKMLNTPISEERTACKNAIAWLKGIKDRIMV